MAGTESREMTKHHPSRTMAQAGLVLGRRNAVHVNNSFFRDTTLNYMGQEDSQIVFFNDCVLAGSTYILKVQKIEMVEYTKILKLFFIHLKQKSFGRKLNTE